MIRIDDDWIIDADRYNYILQKRHKTKKGDIAIKNIGYFSNISEALEKLYKLEIAKAHHEKELDLKSAMEESYAVVDLITEKIKQAQEENKVLKEKKSNVKSK